MAPLVVRLHVRLSLGNSLMAEIGKAYHYALELAVIATRSLSRRFGREISEDEAGYVALLFELALERHNTFASGWRVLVSCVGGRSNALLVGHHYRTVFSDLIERVDACDVSQVGKMDLTRNGCMPSMVAYLRGTGLVA